jgi:hypothetical protein
MTNDPELDEWQKQWQARDTVPSDLRERVEREIRIGRYTFVAPVAVTVLFGGGTLALALRSGQPEAQVLAVAVWVFIGITWVTSLTLARRIGQRLVPEAATATAFLDFTIRSCRAKRAGIGAAAALCPIFLVFTLVWRYQTGPFASVGAYLLSGYMLVSAAVTLGLAVVALRQYRAYGRELDNLRAMQQRFENRGETG